MSTPSRVVVGIDGSLLSKAAVLWATRWAASRGLGLHLVHACGVDAPLLGYGAMNDRDALRAHGQQLLAAATERVHQLAPELTVTTRCTGGFASAALLASSPDAAALVVGAAGHGTQSRATAGAVATQVAAHAQVPVVIVPHEDQDPEPKHRVVVGVDGSAPSLRALGEAFDEAARRRAQLAVVHAFEPRSAQTPALGSPEDWDAYTRAVQTLVDQALTERRRRPEGSVDVDVEIVRGDPVAALVDGSREADLLVVGTRGAGGFRGLHLGGTARGLLGRAAAPVMLIH